MHSIIFFHCCFPLVAFGLKVEYLKDSEITKGFFLSLQDLVNPLVLILDPSSFTEKIKGKTCS